MGLQGGSQEVPFGLSAGEAGEKVHALTQQSASGAKSTWFLGSQGMASDGSVVLWCHQWV